MKQTFKTILVAAAGTAAMAASVPALADPASEQEATIVRIADLDLGTSAGQRSLEQRLTLAAHALCDGASATDLQARNAAAECRREVISAGRAKANAILAGMKSGPATVVAASR